MTDKQGLDRRPSGFPSFFPSFQKGARARSSVSAVRPSSVPKSETVDREACSEVFTLDLVFGFAAVCDTTTGIACDNLHFWNNFGVTFFQQKSANVRSWVVENASNNEIRLQDPCDPVLSQPFSLRDNLICLASQYSCRGPELSRISRSIT